MIAVVSVVVGLFVATWAALAYCASGGESIAGDAGRPVPRPTSGYPGARTSA
jgi:hypothetical protein